MARKKSVSRFAGITNGEASSADPTSDAESIEPDSSVITGGVAGGIAAATEAAGRRVRMVEVAALIPHPLNDPSRSAPGEGAKWDELVNSIKSLGVESPAQAVTRSAFLKARPDYAETLPDGSHVLIFGHRRRIAALTAGVEKMPIIVDDSILENNGDLDAMAAENLGREDLTPLAEARLFAHYVDDVDLSQGAIAKRLGVDQATVSRRLALLLLTEEAAAAVESGQLSPTSGATLAGGLPYGPVRKWQKSRRAEEQNNPLRREDQNTALARILAKDGTPQKIVDFVLAERQARKTAEERGVPLVADPAEALGGPVQEVSDPDSFDGDLVGTVDSITGALLLWSRIPLEPSETAEPAPREPVHVGGAEELIEPSTESNEARPAAGIDKTPQKASQGVAEPVTEAAAPTGGGEAAAAAAARLEACAKAAAKVPPKSQMAEILAHAIAHGVNTSSARVTARADTWSTGTGGAVDDYAVAASLAWRRVLAGYELSAETAGTTWGPVQQTYLQLLADRAGFTPSPLERRLMQRA